MNAEWIANAATFPDAEPFALEVLNDDGECGHVYVPGKAEVDIISTKREDGKRLAIPVAFRSLDQASRAGRILADAFAAVREISDEPAPERCTHERLRAMLFSRQTLKRTVICELCDAVFDQRDVA